ncbi:Chlamydia protein associating with death domains,pyrroloquinoline quinone biosynthesis protein PqqC,Pyrroloquinoline quinone (Coenzyme PQQ) biosynthesis protein C,coenzyme PQQ biosynthesis protein C,TENA/THI-4/PQQC family [Chlamydia serpentis]|uniref:Thiaminase-2/PQQC domain-containing protein n=1 Tax=Chlamydia serpentis TaxID=1967782 RepID=A0A2R8FC30_9CHLA|nr:CADD family putative folate metabolism protein [Chlamydia serpentis]SPN73876.1 Chlamydia protein associating with death domains,pyrroloquinoline quinone biosynthesis protein PqqC,Pyrroloquinoline quinone (Coenzyme PQQ) biosynthesis protein C,coenzyme PQQ biosynthesis protein C,TENA/THI-4/PQQC family [Chlamydia serpentis]
MTSWIALLDKQIKDQHMLKHPFYQRWSEGTLEKEKLQAYAKDYYLHIKAFPCYLSALHARCDDLVIRKHILENLMDEESGNPNHIDLWRQFALSLGVSEEEMTNHQFSKAAQEMVTTFRCLCNMPSLAIGVGALYTYESQIPEICVEKIRGLKEHFGISSRGYAYFTVHQQADIKHASEEREMLEALVGNENPDMVLKGSQEVLNTLWNFLSSFITKTTTCSCA